MALISELVDDFNDNTVDPLLWPNSYGDITETGGRARVPCTIDYAAYSSATIYTLAASSVFCRIYPPANGGATAEAWAQLLINSATEGTDIVFEINAASGNLNAGSRAGWFDPDAVSAPYDPVAHAWLRIRETGGQLLWDTSPDGTAWTNFRTLTVSPAWVADADSQVQLICHRDGGTGDYAEFDNLNVPVAAPPTRRKAAFLAFF